MYLLAVPGVQSRVVVHKFGAPSELESYGCAQGTAELVYLHAQWPRRLTPWSFRNSEGIVLRDTPTSAQ